MAKKELYQAECSGYSYVDQKTGLAVNKYHGPVMVDHPVSEGSHTVCPDCVKKWQKIIEVIA